MLRLVPCLGVPHPMYRRGTSTHALQRGHLAATWPEARSTRRIAFFTTTSLGPATTILVAQTWQRVAEAMAGPGGSARCTGGIVLFRPAMSRTSYRAEFTSWVSFPGSGAPTPAGGEP